MFYFYFLSSLNLLIYFLNLFLEKGVEREGKKHPMCKRYIGRLPLAQPQLGAWPTTQACALTGN